MQRRLSLRNIIFSLAIICLAFGSSSAWAQHFYFAQMTDTHLGDADNDARLAKAIESINKIPMKIESVVITGDVMNNNILDEKKVTAAVDIFKQIKVPVHFLPGNHDILKSDSDKMQKAFESNFGHLASKAEYDGVVFLMVYTEPLHSADYDPIKWLITNLDEAGDKPVIIFTHRPDVDDFWGNVVYPNSWPKDEKDSFESLVKSHNVKAVITGHFHRDELHWIGSVPLYVAGSVAGYFGRLNTYRVYEYTDGKLGYWTGYVDDVK